MKKKNALKLSIICLTGLLMTLSACTKDPEVSPENEQEEYDAARVAYIELTEDGTETGDTTIIAFNKAGTPSPAHSHLTPGKRYRTIISLFYNGKDISNEIKEDGTAHQFFFLPSLPTGITHYAYSDADENGRGIGLDGITTIGAGTFDMKIVLRHGLDKSHSAAADWNSSNYYAAGGSDDLSLMFEIHADEEGSGH
jgi:hypothetical protein